MYLYPYIYNNNNVAGREITFWNGILRCKQIESVSNKCAAIYCRVQSCNSTSARRRINAYECRGDYLFIGQNMYIYTIYTMNT